MGPRIVLVKVLGSLVGIAQESHSLQAPRISSHLKHNSLELWAVWWGLKVLSTLYHYPLIIEGHSQLTLSSLSNGSTWKLEISKTLG